MGKFNTKNGFVLHVYLKLEGCILTRDINNIYIIIYIRGIL